LVGTLTCFDIGSHLAGTRCAIYRAISIAAIAAGNGALKGAPFGENALTEIRLQITFALECQTGIRL